MFRKCFIKKAVVGFLFLMTCTPLVCAQTKIIIQAGKPGAQISPTMYGIFFEDINFGADGGLYTELVKNRGFEFPENAVMGWTRLAAGGSRGLQTLGREGGQNIVLAFFQKRTKKPHLI